MFFSGISDEAGQDIDTQIKAHKELGWDYLELRCIDKVGLTAVPDDTFDVIYDKVTAAGLKVSCFASALANWARPITGDVQLDIDELRTAIPRMHRFGTQFIRTMSYSNAGDHPVEEAEWRREAIARLEVLAKMAEDGGVTLVHENCTGWGGLSAENTNILLGEVNSPALKLVYDTGNPVSYGQDPWAFYCGVRDSIAYVHIKDGKRVDGKAQYAFCGEGDGDVKRIVGDLLATGYDGGFSIEPHLAAIVHTGESSNDAARLYESYVEYGRRLMKLVDEVTA